MTNEQREAIEILKSVYVNKKVPGQITYEEKFAISTVISSLQQKDKEIEKYKSLYRRALSDLVKSNHKNIIKEKQIDLMAEQLAGLTIWNIEEDEPMILGDKEEVKQYFADLVEKE